MCSDAPSVVIVFRRDPVPAAIPTGQEEVYMLKPLSFIATALTPTSHLTPTLFFHRQTRNARVTPLPSVSLQYVLRTADAAEALLLMSSRTCADVRGCRRSTLFGGPASSIARMEHRSLLGYRRIRTTYFLLQLTSWLERTYMPRVELGPV
ncbi:hypothetical protein FISHEDRAFT_55882 [Fistulina hepatica ATCC 64428]|uniref:Uncharacterized protein n=1 Tax=Fistulina hepatica ATCC 64428 TaxID=1128425 RepID=A0A0D7ALQ4_9AGAR|nr:hypothetical protein FISHEDRAFT_55882 [Fistulina hepatica ATCC 64428]